MTTASEPPPPYDEWGRITRFLESARLAFARERGLWASLEIRDSDAVQLAAPAGQGEYRVSLDRHIAAVSDEETLLASVLVHSYALAESAASDRLGIDSREFGGIEDWGERLLNTTGSPWSEVKDERSGAVEVAVIRNVFAHGTRAIDEASAERLAAAGAPAREVGSTVNLTYVELREYRSRLLSLLRLGGVGR